jgi:hypothetical protein
MFSDYETASETYVRCRAAHAMNQQHGDMLMAEFIQTAQSGDL